MFKNTNSNGRFHSDWCRLMLARNLLNEDVVVFISIDNNEVDNLIKISREVFKMGTKKPAEFYLKCTNPQKLDQKNLTIGGRYTG